MEDINDVNKIIEDSVDKKKKRERGELNRKEKRDIFKDTVNEAIQTVDVPFQPTAFQLKYAEELMMWSGSISIGMNVAVGRKAGVNKATVLEWFKDPGFVLWLQQVRTRNFALWRPIADQVLVKNMLKGKEWAVKLFYMVSGDIGGNKTTVEESMKIPISGEMPKDAGALFAELKKKISYIRPSSVDLPNV
jgi:hypothetical protein